MDGPRFHDTEVVASAMKSLVSLVTVSDTKMQHQPSSDVVACVTVVTTESQHGLTMDLALCRLAGQGALDVWLQDRIG